MVGAFYRALIRAIEPLHISDLDSLNGFNSMPYIPFANVQGDEIIKR
jgi:hypothetical protein